MPEKNIFPPLIYTVNRELKFNGAFKEHVLHEIGFCHFFKILWLFGKSRENEINPEFYVWMNGREIGEFLKRFVFLQLCLGMKDHSNNAAFIRGRGEGKKFLKNFGIKYFYCN